MGTAIMVTSGKGGTGKTSLTAGVSSCLAALGKRILCIDLDIGLRNLDIALGMDDRAVMDFTDVMDRRCSLLTGAVEQPKIRGLHLLTAPLRLEHPDFDRFRQVVEEAKEMYDFVLLDSPAGLGDGFQLAMCAADRAVVVSATDPAALRDAQRAVSELIHTVDELHLVMNRVEPRVMRHLHTTIDEAMDTGRCSPAGSSAGRPQGGPGPRTRCSPGPVCPARAVRAYLNLPSGCWARRCR